MATILIIEDEAVLGRSLSKALEMRGHDTLVAETAAAGLQLFDETTPDASCPNAYVRVRKWTGDDGCGNVSAEYVQTITVEDNTAPTVDQDAGAGDVTLECDDDLTAARHYTELVQTLERQPWCGGVKRQPTQALDVGAGVHSEGFSVLVHATELQELTESDKVLPDLELLIRTIAQRDRRALSTRGGPRRPLHAPAQVLEKVAQAGLALAIEGPGGQDRGDPGQAVVDLAVDDGIVVLGPVAHLVGRLGLAALDHLVQIAGAAPHD